LSIDDGKLIELLMKSSSLAFSSASKYSEGQIESSLFLVEIIFVSF